jgi:hypothetical protein
MRPLAFLLVALALGSWSPSTLRAADLSGLWEIDRPAWDRQLDGIVAGILARMSEVAKAELRAQGADPAQALRAAAAQGVNGTVEFLPGGRVRSVTNAEGTREDDRWRLDGTTLRVEVADAEGLEALVGEVAGDRIVLRPVLADPGHGDGLLAGIAYPLVRRR